MDFIFIIWLLMGIISAAIGSAKGGSGIGWFFLGIIFGPFAWLAAAIKSSEPTPADLRDCPYCAEKIQREAKICKHCRSDVEPKELSSE